MASLPVLYYIGMKECDRKPLRIFISPTSIDSENQTTQIYSGEPNAGNFSYIVRVPDIYRNLVQYIRFLREHGRVALCEVKVFVKGIMLNFAFLSIFYII